MSQFYSNTDVYLESLDCVLYSKAMITSSCQGIFLIKFGPGINVTAGFEENFCACVTEINFN